MFKLKELNLELNTIDNVITITPDQRFIDEFKREGSGAFMVTQNNVNAPTQKFESNHPQYVTDQDNFLSHATSSVGGFHR